MREIVLEITIPPRTPRGTRQYGSVGCPCDHGHVVQRQDCDRFQLAEDIDSGYAASSAEARAAGVVRDFCGHGLDRVFHDAPGILHFGEPGTGPVLREGMFFTIKPMVAAAPT